MNNNNLENSKSEESALENERSEIKDALGSGVTEKAKLTPAQKERLEKTINYARKQLWQVAFGRENCYPEDEDEYDLSHFDFETMNYKRAILLFVVAHISRGELDEAIYLLESADSELVNMVFLPGIWGFYEAIVKGMKHLIYDEKNPDKAKKLYEIFGRGHYGFCEKEIKHLLDEIEHLHKNCPNNIPLAKNVLDEREIANFNHVLDCGSIEQAKEIILEHKGNVDFSPIIQDWIEFYKDSWMFNSLRHTEAVMDFHDRILRIKKSR